MSTPRPWRLDARTALLLVLALGLAACGGGGGSPAPGGGGGGGENAAPLLQILAPTQGVAALGGDRFTIRFLANDDDAATVWVLADADQNTATTGDQTVLFTGVDADGVQQDEQITVGLAPGAYTLFMRIDDGVNPPQEEVLPRPLLVYPGVAGVAAPRSNRYGLLGDTVIFSRGEAEDAAGPLNGDGDTGDGVMVALNTVAGVLTQPTPSVSMDVAGVAGGDVRLLATDGSTLAWLTLEADEGRNLNGGNIQSPPPVGGPDVDLLDTMVSYVIPGLSPTPVTNTYGGATAIVGGANGLVVVHYLEAGEGNGGLGGGTDLNADLDALDAMIGYIDPAAPGPPFEFNQLVFLSGPPAASAGPAFQHAGSALAAQLITEVGSAPGTDFNGDGDAGDTFLWLGDLLLPGGTGAPANFFTFAGFQAAPAAAPSPVDGTAAFAVAFDGHAGYYLDEASNNLAPGFGPGNDLNGDGVFGYVPAFYDVNTFTETIPMGVAGPINTAAGTPTMIADGTRLFFTGMEAPRVDPAPGTNGDGDGGADGAILYWTDTSVPGPVPPAMPLAPNFGGGLTLLALALDNGGSATALASGWMAVIVNEAANGGQDINGSGAVDLAYLLVDTSATPAPIVHNPRLVPSAAGTFPLSGVYIEDPLRGDQGVILRLTEAANGDLDGDLNATETFLVGVSFRSPTVSRLLDAGGNHVAVAQGYIGITANEALTGEDYDGNGRMTDHVFRVLDFTGAVFEKGRLCARQSVPATENGDLWVYLRDEAVEARRLNADGDQVDLILGLWVR